MQLRWENVGGAEVTRCLTSLHRSAGERRGRDSDGAGIPAAPPLAPIERRLRTQLRRGQQSVDAVIDLHGMRQNEAHLALCAFLRREQARGTRIALVVTGKGGPAPALFGEERGVLRRMVSHWLRLPELRPLVLGFEEAEQRHGGGGALYVRLRRLREHGP